jgi:hypothetical protein
MNLFFEIIHILTIINIPKLLILQSIIILACTLINTHQGCRQRVWTLAKKIFGFPSKNTQTKNLYTTLERLSVVTVIWAWSERVNLHS